MELLIENDIAQAYIGKPFNKERYLETFNKAGIFYCAHCDIRTQIKFDITASLVFGWTSRNIDFKIRVSTKDGVITYCGIDKYKDSDSGIYVRSAPRKLKPTQQELRLFKRVMEYITIKEEYN